jgi:photosystem II stability/assembly factor-like uncharacterized protein
MPHFKTLLTAFLATVFAISCVSSAAAATATLNSSAEVLSPRDDPDNEEGDDPEDTPEVTDPIDDQNV